MVMSCRGESQYLSTTEGQILHITRWGAGPQICLLLHGFGEGGYVWSDFSRRIPSCYTCIALDFRGHGDSAWDRSGYYSTAMHTCDVISVVSILDVTSLVVIGHSMGAEVAIRAAIELGPRVLGLVMVDYGPELNEEGSTQVRRDLRESMKPYHTVKEYLSILEEKRFLTAPNMLSDLASNALRNSADGLFRIKCDPALVATEDAAPDNSQLWDFLRMIRCPALLVRGNGSAVLPRVTAYRMREILGPTSLREVNLAGHAVMMDNPEGFAEVVLPFLFNLVSS